jgi:hypothetical protein
VIISVITLFISFLNLHPVLAVQGDWSKPRPTSNRGYFETVEDAYSDGYGSIGLSAYVREYFESSVGDDHLNFQVSIMSNTREPIQYYHSYWNYEWYTVYNSTNITGDNAGVWIPLPLAVRYYGATYYRVWVCSNGFISFDSECTEPTPQNIPNTAGPNCIVAALWRDLDPTQGGSITYGLLPGTNKFVISWNSVKDKVDSAPQSFQIVIESVHVSYQDRIYFQYMSVTKNQTTTIGVENQFGDEGTTFPLSYIENNNCIFFQYASQGYWLKQLTMRLRKYDDHSAEIFIPSPDIGGYNLYLQNPSYPFSGIYTEVLWAAGGIMLACCSSSMVLAIEWEVFALVAPNVAALLSSNLQPPIFEKGEAGRFDSEAYITSAVYGGPVFDASLVANVTWKLLDPNTVPHNLDIIAELTYVNADTLAETTISKMISLNMYTGYHYLDINSIIDLLDGSTQTTTAKVWVDGNQYDTPVSLILPQGSYSVQCESPVYRDLKKYKFNTWSPVGGLVNPSTIMLDGDINLWARYEEYCELVISATSVPPGEGTTDPSPGTYDYRARDAVQVTVTALNNSGFIFTHWALDGVNYFINPIPVTMNMNHMLTAYFGQGGGGNPEPCPHLFAWNGTNYLSYGIINIHNSSGQDVTREVSIAKDDVGIANYRARFMLVEGWPGLNFSESTIDQVKLYAVDLYGNRHLCPLITATHSREGNVLLPLLSSDDWKTQILLLETINLTFLMPYPTVWIQDYTFAIEGCNKIKL